MVLFCNERTSFNGLLGLIVHIYSAIENCKWLFVHHIYKNCVLLRKVETIQLNPGRLYRDGEAFFGILSLEIWFTNNHPWRHCTDVAAFFSKRHLCGSWSLNWCSRHHLWRPLYKIPVLHRDHPRIIFNTKMPTKNSNVKLLFI